jgi:hypothetical protein
MGLPGEALETRHAEFADAVEFSGGRVVLTAKLLKYGKRTCTITFELDDAEPDLAWHD